LNLLLSYRNLKYHEPESWKFGEDGNKYFRHATGQIYAISKDLATYISINQYVLSMAILYHNPLDTNEVNLMMPVIFGRPILHKYANEDVSLGSWFIGLEVNHIDERNMCCGTPPGLSASSPLNSPYRTPL
jgi:hypothetical protein